MLPAHVRTAAAGLACLALSAQAPCGPVLAKAFPRLGPDDALLLVRPEDLPKAKGQGDELLLRLKAEDQLILAAAPAPLSLPEGVRWVLMNAQGEEGARGNALPEGRLVEAFLRDQGHPPRWERREAFLREHPDQGEVREEAVNRAMNLVIQRLRVRIQNGQMAGVKEAPPRRFALHWAGYNFTSPLPELRDEQADRMFAELVQALEHVSPQQQRLRRTRLMRLQAKSALFRQFVIARVETLPRLGHEKPPQTLQIGKRIGFVPQLGL